MANVNVIVNDEEIYDFVPGSLGLSTNWQAKLIDDINAYRLKHTKTITLILTKSLSKILGAPLVLDSPSELNPISKPTILIEVDGQRFIEGYMKITSGSIFAIGGTIEFSVIPIEKDFISALKALNMRDIDLSGMNHTFNETNIYLNMTSVSAPTEYAYFPVHVGRVGYRKILSIVDAGGGVARVYYIGERITTPETVDVVGCEDSSYNVTNATFSDEVSTFWNGINVWRATTPDITVKENGYNQTGFFKYNSETFWRMHDFVPAVNMKELFLAMFESIGWEVSGDDYLNILADKWHYQYNMSLFSEALKKRLEYRTGIQEGHFTLTGVAGPVVVPFRKFEELGLNSNQYYNDTDSDNLTQIVGNNHVSEWVAPETGWFHIESRCYFLGNASLIDISVYDGGGSHYLTVDTAGITSTAGSYDEKLFGLAYIPAGYSVRVTITFTGSTFTPVLFDDSYFHGVPVPALLDGMTAHPQEILPNNTAYEWLKDLSLLHQLRLYPDEVKKKVFAVLDKDNMTGQTNDWVQKLDRSAEIEVKPVSLFHPLKYRFDWLSDSNDYEMTFRESISGRYAGGEVDNPNPFVEGTTTKALSIYAATINGIERYEGAFEMGNPIMRGEDGERKDYEARIFEIDRDFNLWVYYEDTNVLQFFYFESNNTTDYPRAYFPEELHFEELIADYWGRMIDAIKFGVLIRAAFGLNATDALKFNDISEKSVEFRKWHQIKVNGTEVRAELLGIKDYQPTNNENTICELLCQILRN